MTQVPEILTHYLAATDSRDKLLKGVGCFFKLLGAVSGRAQYVNFAAAASDARCVMRFMSWVNNVRKINDAMAKDTVQVRDVIYVLRILFDGIFSLLDNVVYFGKYVTRNVKLVQLASLSRASLFYGYVAAVLLDVYDLAYNKYILDRRERYLVLTRNICDMLSSIGNATRLDFGLVANSALGLASAIIASRELLRSAEQATSNRRLVKRGASK